jgi:hypothetical protein
MRHNLRQTLLPPYSPSLNSESILPGCNRLDYVQKEMIYNFYLNDKVGHHLMLKGLGLRQTEWAASLPGNLTGVFDNEYETRCFSKENFREAALRLGGAVYIKPTDNCAGKGVFRLEPSENGGIKIQSNDRFFSDSVYIQSRFWIPMPQGVKESLKQGAMVFYHMNLGWVPGPFFDKVTQLTAPRLFHEYRDIKESDKLFKIYYKRFDSVIAEKEILALRPGGNRIEVRIIFDLFEGEIRLRGSYAKVSPRDIAGNLHVGGHGEKLSEALLRCKTIPGLQNINIIDEAHDIEMRGMCAVSGLVKRYENLRMQLDIADETIKNKPYFGGGLFAIDVVPVLGKDGRLDWYFLELNGGKLGLRGLKQSDPTLYKKLSRK